MNPSHLISQLSYDKEGMQQNDVGKIVCIAKDI